MNLAEAFRIKVPLAKRRGTPSAPLAVLARRMPLACSFETVCWLYASIVLAAASDTETPR